MHRLSGSDARPLAVVLSIPYNRNNNSSKLLKMVGWMRDTAPSPGAFQIPHVALYEEIGRGGRSYAVKVQKPDAPDSDGSAVVRFRREGAILACLRHPGLPAVLLLGCATAPALTSFVRTYESTERHRVSRGV